MAYGFNDDKSKVEVATSEELERIEQEYVPSDNFGILSLEISSLKVAKWEYVTHIISETIFKNCIIIGVTAFIYDQYDNLVKILPEADYSSSDGKRLGMEFYLVPPTKKIQVGVLSSDAKWEKAIIKILYYKI